jgi:O-antigen/teichoic acid export membrane protein
MSALAVSAKGASFLILFQVASRGFTFLVNQVLLRFLSPEILGLSAQLDLYYITVLFFSRESVRVACQRQAKQTQTVVNLAYISILLGIPLALTLAFLYGKAQYANVPDFHKSLVIYGLASIVELLSEPAFLAAQQMLQFKLRASAETVATVGRCLTTCFVAATLTAQKHKSVGVLPFAIGQLVYSILLWLSYTYQIIQPEGSEKYSLFPTRIPE